MQDDIGQGSGRCTREQLKQARPGGRIRVVNRAHTQGTQSTYLPSLISSQVSVPLFYVFSFILQYHHQLWTAYIIPAEISLQAMLSEGDKKGLEVNISLSTTTPVSSYLGIYHP